MDTEKPQIVFVHGGDSFVSNEDFYNFIRSLTFDPNESKTEKWRDWLQAETQTTHQCIYLRMPNAWNADYVAWSLWFDKVVPFLHSGDILIGHSLGGGFYLRYLTENKLPITIAQLHLIAPCVDEIDCEGVGGFKINLANWEGFKSDVKSVHLWHSYDDVIVPIHHSQRFKEKFPTAELHTFTDRGHFLGSTFPELLAAIKN